MNTAKPSTTSYTVCLACKGRGKKSIRLKKSVRLSFEKQIAELQNNNSKQALPIKPKAPLVNCIQCSGNGILPSAFPPKPDAENLPHVAIIGAGICGVALAIACLHRGIPFSLFERDASFNERAQGYGLTIQQATKALKALGIQKLQDGIISTRHVVHDTNGNILGEWGMRKWQNTKGNIKRTNIHIARQALRKTLLEQLGANSNIYWNHKLINFSTDASNKTELHFEVNGKIKEVNTNLVVGADGIRSSVRNLLLNSNITPLRYLGCIVILGICPLANLPNLASELLDGATVFQTVNGLERIYMMPFITDTIMWQMSFIMPEHEAIALSKKGVDALKEAACKIAPWHEPIPQILNATLAEQITGYPVYDRAFLEPKHLQSFGNATIIGDAAHPMSPFKGQGANQALLDAISLAKILYTKCNTNSKWQTIGLRSLALQEFEQEMLERTAVKVKDSANAVNLLHSEIVLQVANEPRGRKPKN